VNELGPTFGPLREDADKADTRFMTPKSASDPWPWSAVAVEPQRIRFGGLLDRCGRPVVGIWWVAIGGMHYRMEVCEGCRDSDEFAPAHGARVVFEAATSAGTNGNGYWVACECACGHVAGARIDDMDRAGRHLRCPACVEGGHPAEERTAQSFVSDPRVRRPL
jgi:hypothetical protein